MKIATTTLIYLLALAPALLLTACTPDAREREGGAGEVCEIDADCEGELVCKARVCFDGDAGEPTNNTNNSNNECRPEVQGCVCNISGENCRWETNNARLLTCMDLCEYVVECFEDSFPDSLQECVQGCERELGSAQEIDSAAACFLTYSCPQILRGESDACL